MAKGSSTRRRKEKGGNGAGSSGEDLDNLDYVHPDFTANVVASLERLVSSDSEADTSLPQLFVFDLDYTLWPLWVDTHVDPPLKRRPSSKVNINKVHDRNNQPLSFFPHVPSILFFLQRHGIPVAIASRTSAPTVARQALNGLLLVNDSHLMSSLTADSNLDNDNSQFSKSPKLRAKQVVKASSLFEYEEIYPGSKITHFRRLQTSSGIEFEEMIFFDDEYRNAEVGTKLGVHFVEVGHSGTDLATFERGIRQWRAKKLARQKAAQDQAAA